MRPVQSAFAVLAMLLFVAGFSLSISASAIPRLPCFGSARRHIAVLASASLAASVALISWVLRT